MAETRNRLGRELISNISFLLIKTETQTINGHVESGPGVNFCAEKHVRKRLVNRVRPRLSPRIVYPRSQRGSLSVNDIEPHVKYVTKLCVFPGAEEKAMKVLRSQPKKC